MERPFDYPGSTSDTADTSNIRTSFQQFTTVGERRVARNLIRAALARGYAVSVCDGTEWTVNRARDVATVTDALATTGEDRLNIWADTHRVGTVYLIWGNEADGSCLIADHTDNDECNALAAIACGDL